MRNLHLLKHLRAALDLPGCQIVHSSTDSENQVLYVTTNTNILLGVSIASGRILIEQTLDIEETARIVGVQYIPDTESVVIAVDSGDIFSIEGLGSAVITNSSPHLDVDIIGSIETGIESMGWSPDFEVVVFVTRAQTLLMMTQNWDTIFEQPLVPENELQKIQSRLALAEPSKIKKETTINDVKRVSEAKTAVSSQAQSALSSMIPIPHVGSSIISWRGDGQYFAVSSPNLESEKSEGRVRPSVFRVWERTGNFFTKSEDGVITQSVLVAWKPSGDIIASVQSLPMHDEVIFFEKNGLRHYEFPIRVTNARIIDLQWNASSDILSTIVLLPNDHQGHYKGYKLALQLWTTKNYHWYMKQEFLFKEDHICLNWDPENGMCFNITTHEGISNQYHLCWDMNESVGKQFYLAPHATNTFETNHSLVAVIDGSRLLLTPFKYQVTPPPMSTLSIETEIPISSVSFDNQNRILILHSDGSISLYDRYQPEIEAGKPPRYSVPLKLIAKSQEKIHVARQLTCLSLPNEFLVLQSSSDQHNDHILHYKFDVAQNDNQDILALHLVASVPSKHISRIYHNFDTTSTLIQTIDGFMTQYDAHSQQTSNAHLKPHQMLPQVCPWFKSAYFTPGEDDEVIIGLTSTYKLFAGDVQISNECNSFDFHSDYLLFTTLTHHLRSISLRKTISDNLALLAGNKSLKFDDSSREIENGAMLVCVVPNSTRVVLQMPRGNLEAIEPRSLILHMIRSHLSRCEYKLALEKMRKQRINLNLFYDHDPALFMENISKFLEQINDIDHLNLFISSLSHDDCTKTTYVDIFETSKQFGKNFVSAASLAASQPKIPLSQQNRPAQYLQTIHTDDAAIKARLVPLKIGKDKILRNDKINVVCDTLRSLMEKQDPTKYLLPILTSLVCKSPAETEKALLLVQKLRAEELSQKSSTSKSNAVMTSEKALKYLVFLVDVNVLYDIALGMYDFDLVILVAQKSQKDPREYLPFLADLQKQDTYFQRYNIDKHLGKWEQALLNLSKAGDERFELCLQLISEKKLFSYGLTIFEAEKRNRVLEVYGDYLQSQKSYADAVLVYQTGGCLEKAFDCAKLDVDWRKYVMIGYQLGKNKDQEDWNNKLFELANICHDRFNFEDAAILLEQYLNKPSEALPILLQGYLWDQALLLCYKHNLIASIEKEVIPAVVSASDALLHQIQEKTVKLTKYHNRLITVRANKYLQAQSEAMPIIEGSETSSMYSGSSQSSISEASDSKSRVSKRSSRSSKSTKSTKSKSKGSSKITGRKGSPNEELYLIRELPGLLPPQRLQDEVNGILKMLFRFGMNEKAIELTKSLQEWVDRGTKALQIINTPSPLTRDEKQDYDIDRASKDELQLALVDPPKIPNASIHVGAWKLAVLGVGDKLPQQN